MATISSLRPRMPLRASIPLFWRVAVTNAVILTAGVAVLAASPATVSSPMSAEEGAVLAVGTALVVLANMLALRHALRPLARLSRQMSQVDPLEPGIRALEARGAEEVVALTRAFNQMAERLESERRESARRALQAQEAERRRIARDVHDDIGQTLTVLLMELSQAGRAGCPAAALEPARETARGLLEDARSISERLRPPLLDDLGLVMAIEALTSRVAASDQVAVTAELDRELPPLDPDTELALFRVAQESLTNVLRHARAGSAHVRLAADGARLRLTVEDDGVGAGVAARSGGGIRGMRERALAAGGVLVVEEREGGGTRVSFEVAAV
jgi:two-component system sensor histidine kinase UhpB